MRAYKLRNNLNKNEIQCQVDIALLQCILYRYNLINNPCKTYPHPDQHQLAIPLSSNMYAQAMYSFAGNNSTFSSVCSILRACSLKAVDQKTSTILAKHIPILININ